MDKEELEWRLSQDLSGIGDFLNRSLSHSPTSSAASTPEPTRRRKSPLPLQQSPRSPRPSESCDPRSPVTLRSHQNGSGKSRLKSSDFERPMFSPRHSSADLFTGTCRYEDISEASDETPCAASLTSPRHIVASARQTHAISPKSRHSAPPQHDDALMTSSTHSEPAVTSSSDSTQQRPTLRRSGTYELLAEEMEVSDEPTLLASPRMTSSPPARSPCTELKQSDV